MNKEKKMIGFYRKKRDGNLRAKYLKYHSKENFRQDIRGNGLRCVKIINKKNTQEILTKKWYKLHREYEQYIDQVKKVKEYFEL